MTGDNDRLIVSEELFEAHRPAPRWVEVWHGRVTDRPVPSCGSTSDYVRRCLDGVCEFRSHLIASPRANRLAILVVGLSEHPVRVSTKPLLLDRSLQVDVVVTGQQQHLGEHVSKLSPVNQTAELLTG